MKKDYDIVITNVVASGNLHTQFNLDRLYKDIKEVEVIYEPEVYPALYIKIPLNGHRKHVTLYRNGKFIIVGGKSEEEIQQIFGILLKILKKNGVELRGRKENE